MWGVIVKLDGNVIFGAKIFVNPPVIGNSIRLPFSEGIRRIEKPVPQGRVKPPYARKKYVLCELDHNPGIFTGPPIVAPQSFSVSVGLLGTPNDRAFKTLFRSSSWAFP